MSIIRIGLAETKHFSEGYASIFGAKKKPADAKKPARPKTQAKKKPAKKKTKK